MQSTFSPLLPAWLEFTLGTGRTTGQTGLKHGVPALLLPPEAPRGASRELLASIHAHREALLASRPPEEGPLGDLLRSLQLRAPRPGGRRPRQGANAAAIHGEDGEGGEADVQDVRLGQANGYTPPALVLGRSEFLLPVDEATQQLYRRLLLPQASSASSSSSGAAAPPQLASPA